MLKHFKVVLSLQCYKNVKECEALSGVAYEINGETWVGIDVQLWHIKEDRSFLLEIAKSSRNGLPWVLRQRYTLVPNLQTILSPIKSLYQNQTLLFIVNDTTNWSFIMTERMRYA